MHPINVAQAAQLLEIVPVGILVLNKDKQITWANEACHTYLGMAPGSLEAKTFGQISGSVLQRVVGQEDIYYVAAAGNRAERWLHCRDQSVEQGDAKIFSDITELRRVQAQQERIAHQLQELATLDPSTGLFTQRALMQNLEPLVSRSRRYSNELSILIMSIADPNAFGAAKGGPDAKQVLLAVGHLLKDQMRWADMISRTATNEFVMVLPETSGDAAQKLIEKIRTHLDSLVIPGAGQESYAVKVRFGVASWQKGDDAQQLLQRAHNNHDQAA